MGRKRLQNAFSSDDEGNEQVGGCSPSTKGNQNQNQMTVMDRGVIKPAKMCVVCKRPFTWRKKWERCWDEVTTCSDACKRKRKKEGKASAVEACNKF